MPDENKVKKVKVEFTREDGSTEDYVFIDLDIVLLERIANASTRDNWDDPKLPEMFKLFLKTQTPPIVSKTGRITDGVG